MPNDLGDVRRSQVITTHGPGAIIDFRAGGHHGASISVVAAGLEEWDRWAPPPGLGHPQTIYEPRLQAALLVEGFRLPPVAPQTSPGVYAPRAGKLVGVRFPRWLQCPRCHQLKQARQWTDDPGNPAPYCNPCSQAAGGRNRVHVVPVRFIAVCENGHLDEFPWDWWVQHQETCPRRQGLSLKGSATAGLAGLTLQCLDCEQSRPMEGCFAPDALPGQCQGRRPWLGTDANETCSAQPYVVQRGASNLYFSVVESALDIPPWSDELQKKIGVRWAMLERAESAEDRRALIVALRLPAITGKPLDEIATLIEDRLARLRAPDRNLRWEEYQQFVQHEDAFGQNTDFEIRPTQVPPGLRPWIARIVRATRLREVRALRGFTRLYPPTSGDNDDRIAKLSVSKTNWLPAVENKGEGIFLELNLARVQQWEAQPAVSERVVALAQQYLRAWRGLGRNGPPPVEVTPRLLLVHSLSHALIRQLALTCGYNSASLRERLYFGHGDWEMAGLLIFTSSPDADGTLGGLARQGESNNIGRTLENALMDMTWCSSDPLCIEGIHSFSAPANGAACHACQLIAETSCELFNTFLDRATLVGTAATGALAFFNELVRPPTCAASTG